MFTKKKILFNRLCCPRNVRAFSYKTFTYNNRFFFSKHSFHFLDMGSSRR